MSLLQRIIGHLQNLVLVSDITIMLISVSLVLMSCTYIYFIFTKENKYEGLVLRLGVLIRVLMLIGFTIEFLHQRGAMSGGEILDNKENAITQFSNYLFYGYLLVTGIYYVFTIKIDKFKGYFYTFDLVMMSIPLLYALTSMLLNLKELVEVPFIVLLVLSLFTLPYLFFKLYWKRNLKWCLLFFGTGIVQLIIFVVIEMKFGPEIILAYLLVGAYEFIRKALIMLTSKLSPRVWKGLKTASVVFPLILIYSSAVAVNVKPLVINKKYGLTTIINKETGFTTLEEAKAVARKAAEIDDSEVKLWQPNTEDFHNVYRLSIENYAIDINGITGKLQNIHYKGEKKIAAELKLSDEELKQKTISWLKSIGYTYDDKIMELKRNDKSDNYSLSIYRKYSDLKTYEDENGIATIEWFRDGKLNYASIGGVFRLEDYKEVKIGEAAIKEAVESFYIKLKEQAPAYTILHLSVWYDSGNKPYAVIRCSNDDLLNINVVTGEINNFSRPSKRESSLEQSRHKEFEAKAVDLAKSLKASGSQEFELDNSNPYYRGDSYYLTNTQGIRSSGITIRLDAEGKLADFSQYYQVGIKERFKLYSDKDFKVSSSEALRKASSLYTTFGIYSKRVKLMVEIEENGSQNFKWMVVIMPLRSSEHHIYFVDVNNGDINPLMEYKAGVRNAEK
jgi:hypothetical protein